MRCEFGYCMVCDREIAKTCTACGAKSKTSEYTEVQVEWSNGSKMQIAICISCATRHAFATPEAKAGITRAHWDAWNKTGGKYDKEIVVV